MSATATPLPGHVDPALTHSAEVIQNWLEDRPGDIYFRVLRPLAPAIGFYTPDDAITAMEVETDLFARRCYGTPAPWVGQRRHYWWWAAQDDSGRYVASHAVHDMTGQYDRCVRCDLPYVHDGNDAVMKHLTIGWARWCDCVHPSCDMGWPEGVALAQSGEVTP